MDRGRPPTAVFHHRRLRAHHHADVAGALLATHGSPAQLTTLPRGQVKVEPRGSDTVSIDGKDQKFERFTIEGLIWGRETLWFDASRNLVAAVTTDAEFDHFEAIREGYESGLGTFVGLAGSDGMAALA